MFSVGLTHERDNLVQLDHLPLELEMLAVLAIEKLLLEVQGFVITGFQNCKVLLSFLQVLFVADGEWATRRFLPIGLIEYIVEHPEPTRLFYWFLVPRIVADPIFLG